MDPLFCFNTTSAPEFQRAWRLALPPNANVLNHCQNPTNFLILFLACAYQNCISLLPPQQQTQASLTQEMPFHLINDEILRMMPAAGATPPPRLCVDRNRTAVLHYTSGTTGTPQQHAITWNTLIEVGKRMIQRLALKERGITHCLLTVPPQHRYGFEHGIMLSLLADLTLSPTRPLLPADLADHLMVTQPTLLITTPLQLRACAQSGLKFHGVKLILSSTAPLEAELAQRVEEQFSAPLIEIYGSTETGAIATRRTAQDSTWYCLPDAKITQAADVMTLNAPYYPTPIPLHDHMVLESDTAFHSVTRPNDLIKIAGKRASLQGLNVILQRIPGVEDGCFYLPPQASRLVAFVVAPTCTKASILNELSHWIDPAFLPRPLYLVPTLKRDETGKIALATLESLLENT